MCGIKKKKNCLVMSTCKSWRHAHLHVSWNLILDSEHPYCLFCTEIGRLAEPHGSRVQHDGPDGAPAREGGEDFGFGGRHDQMGAEVFRGECHETVRPGRRSICCHAKVHTHTHARAQDIWYTLFSCMFTMWFTFVKAWPLPELAINCRLMIKI